MVDRFAFDVLNLEIVKGSVFADNKKAIKFSRRFSGRVYEPEKNPDGKLVVRVETTKEEFKEIDERISRILYR